MGYALWNLHCEATANPYWSNKRTYFEYRALRQAAENSSSSSPKETKQTTVPCHPSKIPIDPARLESSDDKRKLITCMHSALGNHTSTYRTMVEHVAFQASRDFPDKIVNIPNDNQDLADPESWSHDGWTREMRIRLAQPSDISARQWQVGQKYFITEVSNALRKCLNPSVD